MTRRLRRGGGNIWKVSDAGLVEEYNLSHESACGNHGHEKELGGVLAR